MSDLRPSTDVCLGQSSTRLRMPNRNKSVFANWKTAIVRQRYRNVLISQLNILSSAFRNSLEVDEN